MNFNPMELLKNVQNLQSKMSEAQERLKQVTAVGTSGGDMVRITMSGELEVQKVEISPDAVDPNDVEMLQDLIRAAHTDATSKIKEKIKEEMSSVTGGMDLPPGILGS